LFDSGDLDDLFLTMRDIFLTLRNSDVKQIKTSLEEGNCNLEAELLNICYTCVRYGENRSTCKILMESRAFEVLSAQKKSTLSVMRAFIILSMVTAFYNHDMNELYLRACDFCSPEALNEIRKFLYI